MARRNGTALLRDSVVVVADARTHPMSVRAPAGLGLGHSRRAADGYQSTKGFVPRLDNKK